MKGTRNWKRPTNNRGRFQRGVFKPSYAMNDYRWKRRRRKSPWTFRRVALLATILLLVGSVGLGWITSDPDSAKFECAAPQVLDGDTIDCGGGPRVRLQGIDAPELPNHCRPGRKCTPGDPYASTESLRSLINGQSLQCRKTDTDRYGRTIARCKAGDTDLSCAQIESSHAVRRYAMILCWP